MRLLAAACAALLLVLLLPSPGGAQDPGPLAAARALVRAGRLAEALATYTRVVEASPQDLEARKERGRVQGWLGHHAAALADYDHVLAQTPGDVEARVGRGRVLGWMGDYAAAEAELRQAIGEDPRLADAHVALGALLGWQHRHAEATSAFEEARRLAPEDPEPVLGLARIRLWRDDLVSARAAYEEALRLDPASAEAKDGLARIAAARISGRLRLELGFRYETLDHDRPDWRQGWALLTYRPSKRGALSVGVDRYHRFERDDTQLTLGGAWRLSDDLSLAGAFTHGFETHVLARRVYEGEVAHRLAPWMTAGLRYRRSEYPRGVTVDLAAPGLEVALSAFAGLTLRYYHSHTSNAGDGGAASVTLTLNPEGRVRVQLGGAYGRETFQTETVTEVVAATKAATLSAGLVWWLTARTGIRLDYEYEDRRRSYAKHAIGGSVFFELW